MSTSPKLPVRPVRKVRTTLKSSNPPDRQFDPRRPLERKGQASTWRWQGTPRTRNALSN